nr:hypothetical protein [Tanacetum cinerariifolium]
MNTSTSGNGTFSLSNSFEALNVDSLVTEEVNKASTSSGKCVLVDDEGNPLKMVDYPGEHGSEDEVEHVDNKMTSLLASKPSGIGYGNNSLLEQWRKNMGILTTTTTYTMVSSYFFGSKPCSTCSRVFAGDIYGDHAVSCAEIIGIKHRHLVDICCCSGISAGKKVDIGFDGRRDKTLRLADMLLYSWDGGLDVCVDLTGSSHLTQIQMVDFVPGRAVIVAAQRKRGKYMDRCAAIEYGSLPFFFSSLGELEAVEVILLKRIRKFSITQDIGACAAIHIFNMISFAIAKAMGTQIVSRLPFIFL